MHNMMRVSPLILLSFFCCFSSYAVPNAQTLGRITGVLIYDNGSVSDPDPFPGIDTTQDICNPGETPEDLEGFYDTLVGLEVRNDGTEVLKGTSFQFEIRNTQTKKLFRSKRIALYGDFEIPPGETKTLYSLMFRSTDGIKRLPGTLTPLGDLGFRNLTLSINALSGRRSFTMRARSAVSIKNLDRCE